MSVEKPEFCSRLAPALDAYASRCIANHVEKTVSEDCRAMKSFDEYLYGIGYDGGEISESMIADWTKQLSLTLTPPSVNRYAKKVRQALRSAYYNFGIHSPVVTMKNSPSKPVFYSKLGTVLADYADKCIAEHAESTLPSDFCALKSLDSYLCEVGYQGGEISISMLETWVEKLQDNLAPRTVEKYECVIGKALRFAGAYGISYQMVDTITVPDDYQPYIFTPDQLVKLCAAADNITYQHISSYPWIQAEIPMLTRIFVSCGTRTSETLALRMRDVDLEQGVFIMRSTKGNVERYVPFVDDLRDLLDQYCRAMGILGQPDAYLFPGFSQNESLPGYMYNRSFKKMVAEAGIVITRERKQQRSVCPYCFRHTFACMAVLHLQAQGIIVDNIYPYLSAYMGHKDLYSTEKYLKLSEPLMAQSLEPYNEQMKKVFTGRAFNRDEVWE